MQTKANMSGRIGTVTVPMPRQVKGRPWDMRPTAVAFYPGETAEDATAVAEAIAASFRAKMAVEDARKALPCESPAEAIARAWTEAKAAPDTYGDWREGMRRFETVDDAIAAYRTKTRGPNGTEYDPALFELAARFDAMRGKVRTAAPVAPKATVRPPRPARSKTAARTTAPKAAKAAPVAPKAGGSLEPCPRCKRTTWATAAGRQWHIDNNPGCVAFRKPDRYQYAAA